MIKNKISEAYPKKILIGAQYGSSKNEPWQAPVFFHPKYQTEYSPLEEMLCAWLVACESVQPTDIKKLKKSNYSIEDNNQGRLIMMECNYYKGRSGSFMSPAILMGGDIWTKAMHTYLSGLQSESLFKTNINIPFNYNVTNDESKNKPVALLYKIWNLPSFRDYLNVELQKKESCPLFLDAFLELNNGDKQASSNLLLKKEFERTVSRPLPRVLFGLSHIKTTAVHAGSDAYRENDLVNNHSHTSTTEKLSYLTDDNKEWVNQCGRITRLVIHDLQNVVYKPLISEIRSAINDLELRTKLVQISGRNEQTVRTFKNKYFEVGEGGERLVVDSIDTALYFIHYIEQAEKLLPSLVKVRPDWIERTLVVNVEWMSLMLIRMRSVSDARKLYSKIESDLPPLFDSILESVE